MKWTQEAETAIKKVPFFVRKKVCARVEKEAAAEGKNRITLDEVKATRKRFLTNMDSEVKGWQIDTCFSSGECPNRAVSGERLLKKIEALLKESDLLAFLKAHVTGKLKFHHDFRIGLSECPNACSQPQIKDIGIIGACSPLLTDEPCTCCEACVDVCKENAIRLDYEREKPLIDFNLCLKCRQCVKVCPTGTLADGEKGFRIQLGGKLGRHPQLARELPGVFSEAGTLKIINACIAFYKENSEQGQRFAVIFKADDFEALAKNLQQL